MDQPGSSSTHNDEIMDADMEDVSTTLKRTYPGDYHMEESSSSDDSNGNYPLKFGEHSHIGQCKKRRLNEHHETSYFDSEEILDNNINCCRSEYVEPIYVEPIFVAPTSANYPNINPTNYDEPGPHNFNNAETFIPGFWVQFTDIEKDWSYHCIKRCLRDKFGLKCMRGTPLPGKNNFRIIVKFASSEDRTTFLEKMRAGHITQFFTYKCIDNLPIGSLEPDSDNEDYGSMYSRCEHLE